MLALRKVINLIHVFENLDLFDIHSIKQSQKHMENGHKWSCKMHIKAWKVMENHFPCSVPTLHLGNCMDLDKT